MLTMTVTNESFVTRTDVPLVGAFCHKFAIVAKFQDDNKLKTSLKKRICTVSDFINLI